MTVETFPQMFARVSAAVASGEMTEAEASEAMQSWQEQYGTRPAFNYDTDSMSPFGNRGAGR